MSVQPTLPDTPDPGRHADPVFTMHRGGKISVRPVVDVADHQGLIYRGREGLNPVKAALAAQTNKAGLTAADAIAALVGTDAAAGYIIPSQFDERVAPAVAAAVAAQARADGVARR
jgi:hypothetical protein